VLPNRLVTVGWYATPEEAAEDKTKLETAGVTSYLAGEVYRHGERVELRVPESELNRAVEVLDIDASELVSEPDRKVEVGNPCPECRSGATYRILPHARYLFVGWLGVLVICLSLGYGVVAAVALFLIWPLFMWLGRDAGHWRCRSCGWKWEP
jgi:hypothetical protein